MLTDAEIADMAGTAAGIMIDTGTVTRSTPGTTNTTTGDYTPGTPTAVYTGPVHFRVPDSIETDIIAGDEQVSYQRYVAVVPSTAVGFKVDDIFTLTVSTAAALVGVPMRVTFVTGGTINLGYRLALEVIE